MAKRSVVLLVLLLGLLLSGVASAVTYVDYPDQGRAFAACKAQAEGLGVVANHPKGCNKLTTCSYIAGVAQDCYQPCVTQTGDNTGCYSTTPSTMQYHEYPATATCSTRAALVGVFTSAASTGGKYCSFGCSYTQSSNAADNTDIEMNPGNANAIHVKTVTGAAANGNTCVQDATNPPPEPPKPQCLVVGKTSAGDVTQCYDNGQICTYNGANKVGCRGPKQEGEAVSPDGKGLQVGKNDGTPPPPATPPPPGDSWAPLPSTTTNVTNGGSTTNNITNNYGTGGSGAADPPPSGGTGACGGTGQPPCPAPSTCGGEGQPTCPNGNTSGGGTSCGSPPVSAGDALLSQIAYQTWATRCAAEKGQGGTVTGGGDCYHPPVCSQGDALGCGMNLRLWLSDCEDIAQGDILAQQARDGATAFLAELDGMSVEDLGSKYDEALAKAPEDIRGGGEAFSPDDLDASGFLGGGDCPQLPTVTVKGTALAFDLQPFCTLLTYLGKLIVGMAYFKAFRLIV